MGLGDALDDGQVEPDAPWPGERGRTTADAGDAGGVLPSGVWLSRHGAAYGLCQIYRNEPWHFELRRQAIDNGWPATYADPTHDPRMRA